MVSTIAGTGRYMEGITDDVPAATADLYRPDAVAQCGGIPYWVRTYDSTIASINPATGRLRSFGSVGLAAPDVLVSDALFDLQYIQLSCSGADLLVPDPGNHVIRLYHRGTQPRTVHGVTIQPEHVAILAGTGSAGAITFGADARSSALGGPMSAAEGDDGRLYFADADSSQIVAVGTDQKLVLIAGVGPMQPNTGDGGPAVAAGLSDIRQVVERAGIVFIALGNRIRAVNLSTTASVTFAGLSIAPGAIETIAGGGDVDGVAADGLGATQMAFTDPSIGLLPGGDLAILDGSFGILWRLDAAAGAMNAMAGFAGASLLKRAMPDLSDIVVEPSGTILVAAFTTHLFRLDPASGTQTTVAGDGTLVAFGDGGLAEDAGLFASSVARGPDGSIFVGDSLNSLVRRITPDGVIHAVAGGGNLLDDGVPATDAQVPAPSALLVDPTGQLLLMVTDDRVRAVNLGTAPMTFATITIAPGTIATIAGSLVNGFSGDGGPAASAQLNVANGHSGIALLPDRLLIADGYNHRVRQVTLATGIIATAFGNGNEGQDGDGGPASGAAIGYPTALAVSGTRLYVVQDVPPAVRVIDLATGFIETAAGDGFAGFVGDLGLAIDAEFSSPSGISVGSDGGVYVADPGNHHLRRIQQ